MMDTFKVNEIDADGNGSIDFNEFLILTKNLKAGNENDYLKDAFEYVLQLSIGVSSRHK